MAIRIDGAIVRGEISNEIRGLVTGQVWIRGRKKPLTLRLKGNCLRDLAGCLLKFENPRPEGDELMEILYDDQDGMVGDMTASRRSKIPTVTEVELQELLRQKKPVPCVTANTLYLEWFSERNGRVVIETTTTRISVSEPAWHMTAEEERVQEAENQQNFYSFLDKITGNVHSHLHDDPFLPPGEDQEMDDDFLFLHDAADDGEALDGADDEPMEDEADIPEEALLPLDEFEWERELREADRKAAAYQEALEKYKDTPDRDRRVAEAMGWDETDEADLDFDWDEIEFFSRVDAEFGIDGIFAAGSAAAADKFSHHPLSKRVTDLALHLQRDAELRGLLAKHDPAGARGFVANNPYLSVVMHIITLGGKLAAALDGSVHGIDPEPGFVIAMLKRAQIPLNEALHAIGSLFTGHLDENTAEWLEFARTELFDLRDNILEIMRELRARQ